MDINIQRRSERQKRSFKKRKTIKKLSWSHFYKSVYSPVAQSVEQVAVNDKVSGSSPLGGAQEKMTGLARHFFKHCNILKE